MTSPSFERIREVFLEVSAAPESERPALIQSLCAGDAALRREVESLLDNAATGDFLEPDPHAASMPTKPQEMPRSIGPYKLLQAIGEGGFGVVYMAEQEHPVRRRVALKLIRLGMDTKHVLARFEAERQALAMMDHPNIARVLDAGSSESGRPYFVMELVRGVPITEYCDRERLGTRDRLALFIAVCRAVQHAHQKGIIHRDIKPSNVMVTLHDGVPVPKVIDFGIAKATNARLTEKTLFTEFHQFIGTPEYMSPEQAEMSGLDVDTRSDIYSLGVLLYELLSGVTPLDGARLRSEGWVGMQRLIRDFEPVRPSVRLSAESEATTDAARNRGVGIAELKRSLAGDLDWIALRALEKDRARRYETASAFAADIERFLRDEPIEARPPSVVYRARKFIRRNAVPVAIASIVAIGLVGSATSLGLLYTRERAASLRATTAEARERSLREVAQSNLDRAVASEEQARTALARSERVKNLLKSALGADPNGGRQWSRETRASELLDQFRKSLEAGDTEDPEVMAELLGALGDSYVQLGMNDRALAVRTRAVELARTVWPPGELRLLRLTLDLAWAQSETGDWQACRENIAGILALDGAERPPIAVLARAYNILGNSNANVLSAASAIEYYTKALELARSDPESSPGFIAGIRHGLANGLSQACRFAEAMDVSDALAEEFPLTDTPSFNDLRRWHGHALRLWDMGRKEEAVDAVRRLAEASNRVLGPQHTDSTARWHTLAYNLVGVGRSAEAAAVVDSVVALVSAERRDVAHAKMLKIAAWAEFEMKEPEKAEARLREAQRIAATEGLGGYEHPGLLWRDVQVWRLTMDRLLWADDAIRRAVLEVVNDHIASRPDQEDTTQWIDWTDLRWTLTRFGEPAAAVQSGGLQDLRSLRDLSGGMYALRVSAPIGSDSSLDATGWFLIADWDIREFAIDGFAPEYPDRFAAGAAAPDVHRTDRFFGRPFDPYPTLDRIQRAVGFGLVARVSPVLPSGTYDIAITSDDGVRFTVDGDRLIDAWYGRASETDRISITHEGSAQAAWTIEYFQGAEGSLLAFRIEPADGPAREAALSRLGVMATGSADGSTVPRSSR